MTLQIIITLRYGSTACREVYNGFAISLVSEDFCKQND